tara:strand:- start:1688 stop:1963 length:276 start_codon:yes stop_codon:yes gene_type:complete
MNYTKKDIYSKISKELEIPSKLSKEILETFLLKIKKSLPARIVKITNLGTFEGRMTPKRLGRNPKTKESYIIEPTNRIKFISSKKVKDLLN